jgi:hypothetical protein
MKILATILVLLLFLHLECGGSCLAESFHARTHAAANEEPPCHQHGQTPTNDTPSSHHAEGTCAQGPLIEAKLSVSKVVLHWDGTLPTTVETGQAIGFELRRNTPIDLRILIPPPTPISVLRI